MTQKLFAACAVAALFLSLAGSAAAHDENPKAGEKIERSLTVDAQAVVTLCVASGTLKVRGWDKNEIHVSSLDAAQIDFRRVDRVKDPAKPAARIDVMVLDKNSVRNPKLDCQAVASVQMEVPSGATVQVQTRDGDITIAGVAGAYAGSQNGDIIIERATKLVEAGSVGGSIVLKDSSGRVSLNSAGGGVEAMNIRPATEEDSFEANTVSGDIQLDRVSNPKVSAKTVNGTLTMTGPLAKAGSYSFTNMGADIVLAMPRDASFRLNAKISEKHNIISDFPLKYLTEPPPPPARPRVPARESAPKPPAVAPIVIEKPMVVQYVLRRVNAVCGTGDATISIASFGGTIHLKKI